MERLGVASSVNNELSKSGYKEDMNTAIRSFGLPSSRQQIDVQKFGPAPRLRLGPQLQPPDQALVIVDASGLQEAARDRRESGDQRSIDNPAFARGEQEYQTRRLAFQLLVYLQQPYSTPRTVMAEQQLHNV